MKTLLGRQGTSGALLVTVSMAMLAVASPGSAAVLAPKKASDVITLSNFYANPCSQTVPSLKSGVFNKLEDQDGGNSLFSIPTGQAVVITSGTFTAFSSDGSAGHVIELTLGRGSINSPIAIYHGTSTGDFGRVDFRFAEPTGAVVKSGVEICVFARDVTSGNPAFAIDAMLYGFLVPNK